MLALLRRPLGFVPLLISGGLLLAMLLQFMQGTLVRQPDEGTTAHLFQLLMPLNAIVMVVFGAFWLPKYPKPASQLLGLQVSAFVAVLAVVHFRHL